MLLVAVFVGVLALAFDIAISFYVRKNIYTDINKVPYRPYGLVLGTAKYVAKGKTNGFYSNRMDSAKTLFDRKKVDYLLLSGDNRTAYYNEPQTMFRDLKKMGIPEEKLFRDYAGFRTLDSIVRADQVFKAHSITIITQKFHCERALFIAKFYDINAICFAAGDPDVYIFTRLREFFARLQAVIDLLLEKKPHFLGEPEPLPKVRSQ
ncbi:SanA/YdcF family protein [Cricetibacter osteomyelitidis]|nr:ElyC/SanA/YdcF family protein [Cricetibacter osteomyelitidis]